MSDEPLETSNFRVERRILGVLGGQDVDDRMFKSWASASDILVAADAGADLALRHGYVPHAIVGDLDSVSEAALTSGADIYKSVDPDTTDCDKLLAWIEGLGDVAVDLIGVEGDRLDHVLATLGSCAKSRLKIRLVLREGLGMVIRPGRHHLKTSPGARISILPISDSTGVTVQSLQWPIEEATLSLGGLISVSNIALASELDIAVGSGALLVIIEQDGTILET